MESKSSEMTEFESVVRQKAAGKRLRMHELQKESGRSSSVFWRVVQGKAKSRPLVKWLKQRLGIRHGRQA